MKLYNSLTKEIEEIKPFKGVRIGMYTCGPTVYNYATIGNWRTYILSDWILRALRAEGFEVDFVMNLTDVGHLTGDNEGDASTGEDRLEKAAKRENKTAWDVAKFYTEDFLRGYDALNLMRPKLFAKATDHIPEQIAMVEDLEKRGFVYRIDDGMYFDVQAFEKAGYVYGELSTLQEIQEGARVAKNEQKRDPRDFALWKFHEGEGKRDMEWESPWGVGFPGWHIECSAMSMKYLGAQFELHVGGEDLRSTHHPNEIAQSEGASGKRPFVKHWVHGAFLQVDGGRMGKSLGNAYTLQNLSTKKVDVLSLRYFYMTGHYRKPLNFTWESIYAAKTAYHRLKGLVANLKAATGPTFDPRGHELSDDRYVRAFFKSLEDDINLPAALAVVWELFKNQDISSQDAYASVLKMDEVMGLALDGVLTSDEAMKDVSHEVRKLIDARDHYRAQKDFTNADILRAKIEQAGYVVEDKDGKTVVRER